MRPPPLAPSLIADLASGCRSSSARLFPPIRDALGIAIAPAVTARTHARTHATTGRRGRQQRVVFAFSEVQKHRLERFPAGDSEPLEGGACGAPLTGLSTAALYGTADTAGRRPCQHQLLVSVHRSSNGQQTVVPSCDPVTAGASHRRGLLARSRLVRHRRRTPARRRRRWSRRESGSTTSYLGAHRQARALRVRDCHEYDRAAHEIAPTCHRFVQRPPSTVTIALWSSDPSVRRPGAPLTGLASPQQSVVLNYRRTSRRHSRRTRRRRQARQRGESPRAH